MRAVHGYEALDIAENYGIALYDTQYRTAVSAEQARQFIRSQRDAQSFVLKNWPDSEEEADEVVLKAFHSALMDRRRAHATIEDVLAYGEPMHLDAVDMAIDRLLEQNRLEFISETKEGNLYGLPRTTVLSDLFVKHVKKLVCEECARADFQGPFHESCLRALFDFIKQEDFTFEDITEERVEPAGQERSGRSGNSKLNMQKLYQSVSGVTSKWQARLKPLLHAGSSQDTAQETIHFGRPNFAPQSKPQGDEGTSSDAAAVRQAQSEVAAASASVAQASVGNLTQRPRVTKEELLRYLQHVEIVDESGELGQLREERTRLVSELEAREREMSQFEKKRAFLEQQNQEIQRDMDTLLEAMQIAKRRGHGTSSSHVVEATLVEGDEE